MPRAKPLSHFERGQVTELSDLGYSSRAIAERLGRSKTVVNNFLKDPGQYGTKKSAGRPKKITPRDARAIRRTIRDDSGASIPQIIGATGVQVSRWTLGRHLKAIGVKKRKRLPRPRLLQRHKTSRLAFAQENQTRNASWGEIVFSDEKKINLDGPDGYQYYWADPNFPKETFSKRASGGGSVMVWGAISSNGKMDLQFIDGRLNANGYQQMLQEASLEEEGRRLGGENWIFMQDNAPIHKARSTMAFFNARNIALLEWPACSPDLNPIENCWGWLSRKVYGGGQQFSSLQELKDAILQSWAQMSDSYLQGLINSMPQRMFEVIHAHGGHTHY